MSHSLFMSHKADDESIKKAFYLRQDEYKKISKALGQQKKHALQHFLITGKRGLGKSTLLKRISIEAKEKHTEKLIPVYLGAEQYSLSKLHKLWRNVIEYLYVDFPDLEETHKAIFANKNYAEQVQDLLFNFLKDQKKSLLIMIDNFDQFIAKLKTKDQHAFREILIEQPIQIIGNCLFYTEDFYKYDAPFFDFFQRVDLPVLSHSEFFDYLHFLSKDQENGEELIKEKMSKLETLYVLCGGVPRTIVLLFEIFFNNDFETAIEYLKEAVDQTTALYQDRMNRLAPLQQEIIYEMALIWDRCAANEIADRLQITTNAVNGQLKKLEKNGYIKSFKLDGFDRLKYHEIDERFFNIWLLMSEASPHDGQRVIWLTKWLEAFYNEDELIIMALNYHKLQSDEYSGNIIDDALFSSSIFNNKRLKLKALRIGSAKMEKWKETCHRVSMSDYEKQLEEYILNGNEFAKHISVNFYFNIYNADRAYSKIKAQQNFKDRLIIDFKDVIYLLWFGEFTKAKTLFDGLAELRKDLNPNDLSYLIVFKQNELLERLFKTRLNLKDEFLPLYYLSLITNKDNYAKEYQKMPSELIKPVNDLKKWVKSEQLRLGIEP